MSVSAELEAERADYPLEIVGSIPDWLSGTLARNGPVYVTVNGRSQTHWFDGLAMLHAFSFQGGMFATPTAFCERTPTERYLRRSLWIMPGLQQILAVPSSNVFLLSSLHAQKSFTTRI
jgi:carotenoid cleavage dioxygenase-like enzyme